MSIIGVFPGQGSQTIGMGMEVSKTIKSAKNVLDEVDDALNFKLSKVMKEGNEETLRLTKNAQPALMATGIAVVRAIEEISGKKISQIISHAAGHSLGEYTALVSAGSISISDAAKLLRVRGEAMQNAVPVGLGSMVAILGVTIEDIEYFIGSVGNSDGLVEIANDNAPGQVVISGDLKTLNSITTLAKESGVRKIIKLSVSAPFHCSLMKSAAKTMEKAFQDIDDEVLGSTYNYIQKYNPKKREWRITIVGDSVFPCVLESQDSDGGQEDWRKINYQSIKHYHEELPGLIKELVLDYVNKLKMPFGAMDLIETPDGQWYFFECNPNGQW